MAIADSSSCRPAFQSPRDAAAHRGPAGVQQRSYAAGTGLNVLTGFALFGGSFMFSLYAGSVLHYSALEIGKVFLAAGSISVLMMPIIGRIGPKVDGRILLATGSASWPRVSSWRWT